MSTKGISPHELGKGKEWKERGLNMNGKPLERNSSIKPNRRWRRMQNHKYIKFNKAIREMIKKGRLNPNTLSSDSKLKEELVEENKETSSEKEKPKG